MVIKLTLTLTLITIFFGCKQPNMPETVMESSDDLKKGESFLNTQHDSAFFYLNKVVSREKDSLQLARAYSLMAFIQSDAGDYYGAQETALKALSYLTDSDDYRRYYISSNFHELAVANMNLRNYATAIEYSDKAIALARDSAIKAIALNTKAVTLQRMGDYQSAASILQAILDDSKQDSTEYARVMSNLARVKWLRDPHFQALPLLQQARQIRVIIGDENGLSTSYSHLAEYYSKENRDSAFHYARLMYQTARSIKSPDDELDALQKLIENGPADSARNYFSRYRSLNDSIQTRRTTAKNQLALIRYEAEGRKLENLSLQQENAEKGVQILKQRLTMIIVIAFFALLGIIGYFLTKRRRQKILADSQNAIREERLKTSRKVHDVVANGLYRVMSEIEHDPLIKKEYLLDQIENLYEQSRDISYEKDSYTDQTPWTAIDSLLNSFAGSQTRVLTVGNSMQVWEDVSRPALKEMEQVLQELMVNMKKHSRAGNVVFRFERLPGKISIQYSDDGVGWPPGFTPGNGLSNTENRISRLGGHIKFENGHSRGVMITISLPIEKIK